MRKLKSVGAIALTCGLSAACDDAPAAPSRPLPPPPASEIVTSLELSGQTTLAPGASADFTLIAVFADGTRNDVTGSAQWSTRNSTVVVSEDRGRIRAGTTGDTTLDVRYKQGNVSREIIVVPDGTFRVVGRILEYDGVTPVANAHIQVRDGGATGPSTTADTSGFYRLYGVRAATTLVVTGAGYEETEQRVWASQHATINIAVARAGPRLNVAGTYTVVFDWSQCGPGFPVDLRRRVYAAVVQQSADNIQVEFTEREFLRRSASRPNLIYGRVHADGIYLIAEPDYYYPIGPGYSSLLTEILPDNYLLAIWGRAFLAQSGHRFSGTFKGNAWLQRADQASGLDSANCMSGNVSFERR